MTPQEINSILKEIGRQIDALGAVVDQTFRTQAFLSGTLLATVICVALFSAGVFTVWRTTKNGELAKLKIKFENAAAHARVAESDFRAERRWSERVVNVVSQFHGFLKSHPARLGQEAEHERLIVECEAVLAENDDIRNPPLQVNEPVPPMRAQTANGGRQQQREDFMSRLYSALADKPAPERSRR